MDKQSLSVSMVGMVWYAPEHFAEVKAMMEDGHKLHATYAEWQVAAENGERHMRSKGGRVVRALLVPAAFREFCSARGLKLNADARNQFANTVAIEEYRNGG